jgi:hypothetical protein
MADKNQQQQHGRPEQNKESGEDFAPTHGRSPEIIKEMIQARRATDVVPDPEDIAAGQPENSPEDKEHGRTQQAAAGQASQQRGTSAKTADEKPKRPLL